MKPLCMFALVMEVHALKSSSIPQVRKHHPENDCHLKQVLKTILNEGDCAVVFHAGHGFSVLEEGTILYEVKNGPYYGQLKDKSFIEGEE